MLLKLALGEALHRGNDVNVQSHFAVAHFQNAKR